MSKWFRMLKVVLTAVGLSTIAVSSAFAGPSTARVGGNGGSDFLWPWVAPPFAPEPAGQWATGIWGRWGSRVNAFGLGFETFSSPAFGGSGGTQFSAFCPWGYRLKGLQGRAGSMIDKVQAVCVHIDDVWGPNDWQSNTPAERIHVDSRTFGGNGGNFFSIRCAKGHAVYAFEGRSGKFVDALQFFCSNTVNF